MSRLQTLLSAKVLCLKEDHISLQAATQIVSKWRLPSTQMTGRKGAPIPPADTTPYASECFSAFSLLSKILRHFGDSNPGGKTTLILTINTQ
jgi:hypothetical protein